MFDKKNYARYRQRSMPDTRFRAKYGFNIPTGVPSSVFGLSADAAPPQPGEHESWSRQAPEQSAAAPETLPPMSETQQNPSPPFIDPGFDSDEWERRFPSSRKKKRSIGARLWRVTLVSAGLILAIFAGLVAAWWINTGGDIQGLMAMLAPQRSATAAAEHARPALGRGTSLGELPYDGSPPDDPGIAAGVLGEALAKRSDTSAATMDKPRQLTPSKALSAPSPSVQNNQAPRRRRAETAPGGSTAVPAQGASAAPSAPQAQQSQPVPAVATTGQPAAAPKAKPRKARQKQRASHPAAARGKEIDRIQQQADAELKKKTENRRAAAIAQARRASARQGRYMTSPSKSARTYAELSRCGRLYGLIRRELCKWETCNGKWGKDGCPSYAVEKRGPGY